jgi:serine/alanine adding enzyme
LSFTIKKCSGNVDVELVPDNLNKNLHFSVFQSVDFFNLFKAQKNAIPLLYTVWDEEKLTGWLLAIKYKHTKGYPGFLTSRTVIWGGPLLFGETDCQLKSLDKLLKALIKDSKNKSALIEFRNMHDLSAFNHIFEKNGFELSTRMNCVIEMDDKNMLLKQIKDSKLRQISKSLKQGVVITEAENIGQVHEFYNILKDLYHDKVRKPLPEQSFFEAFYHWGKQSGLGVILLTKFQDKIIGGSLCPITIDHEIFEWYTAALTIEYRQLYPGVLATWAPMEYALKNNINRFNFMGIGSPDKPYGVRNFKLQFGGSVNNYGRFTRINNPAIFKITKAGYRLMGFRE